MPQRATLLGLWALYGLLSARPVLAQEPKAESRTMRLFQAGSGRWTQSGRADLPINQVILVGSPAQLNLHFVSGAGAERVLTGKLEGKDATQLHIKVTNSGNPEARGNVLIEYGVKNSINSLWGSGLLDGQPFAVQFTRHSTLRLNAIAFGKGSLSEAAGPAEQVQWVSVFEDSSQQGEVAFFLGSGEIRKVSGRVKRKATGRNLLMQLSDSGPGNASGILIIRLGKSDRIASIKGECAIDSRPARIHFEAVIRK